MNAHSLEMLNSRAIREEIQRFESVHPHIYAIYDLLEQIEDGNLQDQFREHVVCIEGKFSCSFSSQGKTIKYCSGLEF